MIRILTLVFALAYATATAATATAPASDASIRELLRVTDAQKLVEGMIPQIEGMMKGSMQQALGRPLTVDEQRLADSMNAKMLGLIKDELSWETLEPLYLRIYRKTFTQEELDGMLAFYKTPAGEALIKKLPMVMQETMASMQARMGPLMQKVQAAIQDTVEEINVAKRKKG